MGFVKRYIRGICLEVVNSRKRYNYLRFNKDYRHYKKGDIISGVILIQKNGVKVATIIDGKMDYIDIDNFGMYFKSVDSLKKEMEG